MKVKWLVDKVAVITGAAGAIGRAIARSFAEHGARVCLCDNDESRLLAFADKLKEQYNSDNVMHMVVDVRKPSEVSAFMQKAESSYRNLDILVNNAAVTMIRKIDEITDGDIDNILDTNLKGYFYCAREAVKIMKKRETKGVLLMVSSKNGLEGASEKSLYAAAKGGELAMARSLAKELGPLGIRVNSICPDAVHEGSKLWEKGGHYSLDTAKRYNISEDEIPEYYRQRCSLKVNIKPKDIANAALFLVSEQSSKITGAVLPVDGGVAYVR